jgi:hypothetical protein
VAEEEVLIVTPLLSELREPPVVGNFYRVPVVLYSWFDRESEIPIHGSWHEDQEHIGFGHYHYHVDQRFLYERDVRRLNRAFGGRASVFFIPLTDNLLLSKIVLKRRKCLREFSAIPMWFPDLVKAFTGRSIEQGRCPHKGYDLRTVRPSKDGCVTCPLHGLIFRDGVCVSSQTRNNVFETVEA